jgi:adenine/guanine phosphoribosyltransferase-like PRPP-binding protein
MDPDRASRLAIALAGRLPRELRKEIGKVVSPAMGGVIIGHEMGRALGVEAMFVERPTGTFELRVQNDTLLVGEAKATLGGIPCGPVAYTIPLEMRRSD